MKREKNVTRADQRPEWLAFFYVFLVIVQAFDMLYQQSQAEHT